MASGKSTFSANTWLDEVLGGSDYTPASTVYVALYTVTPGANGGGTEVSGGSYARVAVTNNSTNWPAASGGVKANGAAITFPTASASWGTVTGFALMDAASGGNELYFGDLTLSKVVSSGDTASFAIGALSITEA